MIKNDLLRNAREFEDSANEDLARKRFNVAISNFFKAIVIYCDCYIYGKKRYIPKNHSERFVMLKIMNKGVYSKISDLFSLYRDSYNLRMSKSDALKFKEMLEYVKKNL